MEVDFLEAAAVVAGEPLGDFDVLLGGTTDVALLVFHADADVVDVGGDALLFQQVHYH